MKENKKSPRQCYFRNISVLFSHTLFCLFKCCVHIFLLFTPFQYFSFFHNDFFLFFDLQLPTRNVVLLFHGRIISFWWISFLLSLILTFRTLNKSVFSMQTQHLNSNLLKDDHIFFKDVACIRSSRPEVFCKKVFLEV